MYLIRITISYSSLSYTPLESNDEHNMERHLTHCRFLSLWI